MEPGECEREHWVGVALRLGCHRVLVVCNGCAPESMVVESADGASITMSVSSGDPADQQRAPFPVACLGSRLAGAAPEVRRAAIHQAVQHLEPGGVLALHPAAADRFADLCHELGLEAMVASPVGVEPALLYRRPDRTTVHDLLWTARASIGRVGSLGLIEELTGEHPPIIVDTRTHTERCRSGVIAGSIHVPRTVLEWHLDPANGYRHPAVAGLDDPLVLVCNGGYSSSLAAASLVQMGFTNVRDLIGGMRAWSLAGLPVVEPDHAHVDH